MAMRQGGHAPDSNQKGAHALKRFVKICNAVFAKFSVAGYVFIILCVLVAIANIILRRIFNFPIHGSTEMVQLCGLVTACLAIVETEWADGNVSLTILTDKLPAKAKNVLMSIVYAINVAIFVLVDVLLVNDMIRRFNVGRVTAELGIPWWVFSLILAFGFVFLTIVLLAKLVVYCAALKTGEKVNFFLLTKR